MMEHTAHHRWQMARPTPTSDYPNHLTDNASPYLLPEWALFWERVWRNARAEVWQTQHAPSMVALCVRRRRALWNWVHVLPYATPGSFGITPAEIGSLIEAMTDTRTVQISFGGMNATDTLSDWRSTILNFESYVLDVSDSDESTPLALVTEHHQRNIDKGRAAHLDIRPVRSSEDVRQFQASWRGRGEERSRLVLDAKRGSIMAEVFAGSDGLAWSTAWQADTSVATCLWLVRRSQAVYVDGAVDRTAPAGVNHHLFATVLTSLYKRGVRYFDFGGGPLGQSSDGLVRFKEGWGAAPETRFETILRRPQYASLRRIVR